MSNNIATYTICIDTKNLEDLKDIEEKILYSFYEFSMVYLYFYFFQCF